MPRKVAVPVPGAPRRVNTFWTDEPEMVVPAALATSPMSTPVTAMATHHPTMTGRSVLIVRPTGPPSRRRWAALVDRSATVLAPRSRLPASRTATRPSPAEKTATGTRAHGRGVVSGWSCSIHPSGETHRTSRGRCRGVGHHAQRVVIEIAVPPSGRGTAWRRVAANWLVERFDCEELYRRCRDNSDGQREAALRADTEVDFRRTADHDRDDGSDDPQRRDATP